MTLKRTDFAADNGMPQDEIVSGQKAFSRDWRQKHSGPGSGGEKFQLSIAHGLRQSVRLHHRSCETSHKSLGAVKPGQGLKPHLLNSVVIILRPNSFASSFPIRCRGWWDYPKTRSGVGKSQFKLFNDVICLKEFSPLWLDFLCICMQMQHGSAEILLP
jgi:hypothetical protein